MDEKRDPKTCLHNIISRDKPDDPWYCARCGTKISNALARKRMNPDGDKGPKVRVRPPSR